MVPQFFIQMALVLFVLAFSANGKDVIVDFPQQSHWTGLLSEMELVPSVHPGVRYGCVRSFSPHVHNIFVPQHVVQMQAFYHLQV